MERRPGRALFTVVGLAMACAVMMVGRFQGDSVKHMVDVQLSIAQTHDIEVSFVEPAPRRAVFELAALPGVREAEPLRSVPVRSYHTSIEGVPPGARLRRPIDARLRPVQPQGDGVLLTDYLQQMLDLKPGDRVEVQALEGHRRLREVPVAGFVHEYIGARGYMDLDALDRLLGDGDVVSGALLGVMPGAAPDVYARLDRRPWVAGVASRLASVRSFYATMGESLLVFTLVAALLGAVINFGVVYNAARISLSERGRELASLCVLGMTRGEVGALLLGQLGLLVAVSLPSGLAAGWLLCWLMALGFQSELFRVPVQLTTATYAFAALVTPASRCTRDTWLTVLGASTLSALLVYRSIAYAAVAWWALQPAPRPLDVVRVQRGELVQRFEEEGRTELARRWMVAAPIAGTLRRIALLQGDPVKAGQELAQIEPLRAQLLDPANRARLLAEGRAAQVAMQAARQRQAAAQADAGLAARDVARMRKLGAAGAISVSALDGAEARVSRAGRGIRCRRRLPRRDGGQVVPVLSPIDGVVLHHYQPSATPVQAGQPLLELGDLGQLQVMVRALSQQAILLHPGTPAQVLRWGDEGALAARVAQAGVMEKYQRLLPDGYGPSAAIASERSADSASRCGRMSVAIWT